MLSVIPASQASPGCREMKNLPSTARNNHNTGNMFYLQNAMLGKTDPMRITYITWRCQRPDRNATMSKDFSTMDEHILCKFCLIYDDILQETEK